MLYGEHLLNWNRRVKEGRKNCWRQFRLHHQFLEAARLPFELQPQLPASIFVFETLEPSNSKMGFDYWDNAAYFFETRAEPRIGPC